MVIWWFKDTELQLNMVVSMICWDFSDFAALTEKKRGQWPLVSGERMSINMWAGGATGGMSLTRIAILDKQQIQAQLGCGPAAEIRVS